jgi:ABC-2 type transport system permease protein
MSAAALPAIAGRRQLLLQLDTFTALLARDLRVLRRQFGQFLLRTIMQPLLFVFVFGYVFPKIGQGFSGGKAGSFTTVLVPGLIGVAIVFQGIQSVAIPLVQEFSISKEIEDRVLSPVPVWLIALEKIVAGAIQSVVAAIVVFPIVYLVHAHGESPHVHIHDWALFVFAVIFASLLSASVGLFLGTVIEPRKITLLFSVIVLPITFLGCVYYPWGTLSPIPWLKYLVLLNPLVYMTEALRASLTPQLPHMPVWAFMLALVGGSLGVGLLAIRTFQRRVVT